MKIQKYISSLRRVILVLAAVFLVAGVSFAPRPAMAGGIPTIDIAAIAQAVKQYAQDAAAWAKQAAQQSQIISTLIDTYNSIVNGFNSLQDTVEKTTALQLAANQAESKQQSDQANFAAAADYYTAEVAGRAAIAAERPPTPALDKEVCYKLHAQQTLRNLRSFKHGVSTRLLKGMVAEGTVLGDKQGPLAINADFQNRCGAGTGGNGFIPDHLNPPDKKCSPAAQHKDKVENADISITTLTTAIDSQPLDEPNVTSKTVTDPRTGAKVQVEEAKPNPNEVGELLFAAARDYCYHVAGPEKVPPMGDALKTPGGQQAMATYSHCMSMKTALVKQCTDRVAYLTRPNKTTNKQNYDETVADCKKYEEVKDANGKSIMPDTVDCDKGLSPFQAEYLAHMACSNGDGYVKKAAGGSQTPSLLTDSDQCMLAMTEWQNKLNQDELAFIQAVQSLHDMKDCWGSK